MMVTCMNDAGTGATPDPLYNSQYSQFCYEIPFMPGQTQYMDTPVVPTSAFASAGYNNPDCDYPDATPAISEVDAGTSATALNIGPWTSQPTGSQTRTLRIYALGDVSVNNYGYSGPSATTTPFNQKTITRHYGFGTQSSGAQCAAGQSCVALVSTEGTTVRPLTVTSWSDTAITATVSTSVLAPNAMNC